jgi:RNA polymerase sigma-70 factor (ECF subfamily)
VQLEVASSEVLETHAESAPSAEALVERKQLRQQLDRALDCLNEDQRQVFVLYELEGYSVPELAALLEVPTGTVASRLGRARERFRRAVHQSDALKPAGPHQAGLNQADKRQS